MSSIHVSPSCNASSAQSTWNLPDLLVGLDGIATRSSSDNDSPPMMYNSVEDRIGNMTLPLRSASDTDTCSSPNQLLTSTIPCISLPNLDLVDHHSSQDPSRLHHNNNDPHHPQSPFYFDTSSFTSHRVGGHNQTDSLLEGLGILSPAPVTSVKTEMVSCSSPQPQSQFSLVTDPRESPGGQITMDLSQLVSQHNIPQQFELSLSPKCEPGQIMVPSQTNRYKNVADKLGNNSISCVSIPISTSFSLSNITNIASVSIANIDLLNKTSPLSLDLIAQHCTLLPPELVSLPPVASLSPATTTYITQDQDIANNNIQEMETVITPVNIKEVLGMQVDKDFIIFVSGG